MMPGLTTEIGWRGERIRTLADVLAPGLGIWIVGLNPSVASVSAGHYYQGRLGQRVWGFFERAGVVTPPPSGRFHDEFALGCGLGLTDLVKRPTAAAAELVADDYLHGLPAFLSKLEAIPPRILAFTFKEAAEKVVGRLPRHLWGPTGVTVAGADLFLAPIAYQKSAVVHQAAEALRQVLDRDHPEGTRTPR